MKTELSNRARLGLSLLLFAAVPTAQAFYDPGTQRWLTRDPIGEPGFEIALRTFWFVRNVDANLYTFVLNSPVKNYDSFGLKKESTEDDCQARCLKFCNTQPDPADCGVKCFAECATNPNYIPSIISKPRCKPSIPKGGREALCEIWNACKDLYKEFHKKKDKGVIE